MTMHDDKLRLTVINRIGLPSWVVRPICNWIATRAGIKHRYTLTLSTTRYSIAGRGGKHGSRCRINLRYAVSPSNQYTTKYWRYEWSVAYQLRTRLELLVDIVAHEMSHATIAHPSRWVKPGGRNNLAGMETAAEAFSRETVAEFRKWWPQQHAKVVAAAKRCRATEYKRAEAREAKRSDPTPRLRAAEAALVAWVRRGKLAATKVRKYRRRVKYYSGKIAAKAGSRVEGGAA